MAIVLLFHIIKVSEIWILFFITGLLHGFNTSIKIFCLKLKFSENIFLELDVLSGKPGDGFKLFAWPSHFHLEARGSQLVKYKSRSYFFVAQHFWNQSRQCPVGTPLWRNRLIHIRFVSCYIRLRSDFYSVDIFNYGRICLFDKYWQPGLFLTDFSRYYFRIFYYFYIIFMWLFP